MVTWPLPCLAFLIENIFAIVVLRVRSRGASAEPASSIGPLVRRLVPSCVPVNVLLELFLTFAVITAVVLNAQLLSHHPPSRPSSRRRERRPPGSAPYAPEAASAAAAATLSLACVATYQ